ncbi:MAG: T9SS C-terminal target domain-containing protein [Ignavibacteriales bacterium]|nr:MAG: T9SS C-terminal target domain-containing protein [Ignavibacteriales bacterium]
MIHKYDSLFVHIFIFSVILFSTELYSQAGSVELKDGGGTLISSHSNITDAYNAIPNPISQSYIIEILSAYDGSTETFPVTISERSGSSASNTITLRPAAGNSSESIVTSISNDPTILLDGVDFFILDGRPGGIGSTADLLVQNTIMSGTSSHTIEFINGASDNIVRYCNTLNGTAATSGPRNIFFGTSVSTGNNNNLVEFCNINGGRSGVGLDGSTGILNSGNTIRNCLIYDFGFAGVWLLGDAENTTIENCEIYQTVGISSTAAYGINTSTTGTNGVNNFIKNKIYNIQHTSTSTSASIRGIYGTVAEGSTFNVHNNFVSLTLDNQNTVNMTGIHFLGTNNFTANIFYNTVRIGGNQTGGTSGNVVSSCVQKANSGATTTFNLANNILINNRTGGNPGVIHAGLNMSNTTGVLNINYNNYFADGGSGAFPVSWGGITYDNLANYQAAVAPLEQNTIFKNVEFVSNTDLHLTGASQGDFDLAGTPLGIPDDIDGDPRNVANPYKGADESTPPLPVELSSFTSYVSGNSITLTWITSSEINNRGFDIERNFNNEGWIKAGFVNGNGTSTELNTYSFNENNLLPGIYNYRIKQIDFNGSYHYFNLDSDIEINSPLSFDLSQNFPNPFNPSTQITYSVAKQVNVKLVIFNSIGEEIAVLINEQQQPGKYMVNFEGGNLSTGVYFYKISAGDFVSVKKMLMIK